MCDCFARKEGDLYGVRFFGYFARKEVDLFWDSILWL
jgi:hypothetical protein